MVEPQKFFDVSRGRESHSVDAEGNKRREPNQRKEFSDLLNTDAKTKQMSEEEQLAAQALAAQKKGGKSSVFELSAKKKAEKKVEKEADALAKTPVQSPFAPQERADIAALSERETEGSTLSDETDSDGDYAQLRNDLSSLGPALSKGLLAEAQVMGIRAQSSEAVEPPLRPLQEMVDLILSKVYTLRQEGLTETVLVLKQPPVMEGAQIVLSAFDSARGEFNIAIHNLTQMAERFLTEHNARLGLKQALEEHGYAVHILLFTSSAYEQPLTAQESSRSERDKKEEQGDKREGDTGSSPRKNK